VPEELGREGAARLLEEIYRGGCVDSASQSLAALLMALGPPDVSKVLAGPLSPYTVQFLRHARDFLHLMFKLETRRPGHDEEEDRDLSLGADKVLMTCVGTGYTNLSKRTT
jgi:RNA 3'-terminal phosphate cyclase-like protein